MVVADGKRHDRQLRVHPAISGATPDAVAKVQPQAKNQRRHRQESCKAHQLVGHQQQALPFGGAVRRNHSQIDENSRQIKKPSEPAGDEHDVK